MTTHNQTGRELMRKNKHADRLPPQNALVKKSNRLVEASYDLSLQQLRLIHWLSRVVQEDDEDYKYYDIDVPLFLQFLQLKGSHSARDRIREVTKKLQEKTILIRQLDSEDEWEQFSWLRYSKVFRKDNRLVLRLSMNPEMLPYIRDLRAAFTKTSFYQITAFRSRYGWRIYEWCKQFENTGWLEISVSDLRTRLQIGDTEYTRFNNLRQRVIAPALDEVNRVSDLSVTLEKTIRRGRSVHALRLAIEKKEVHILPVLQDEVPNERTLIVERLMSHGMPETEATKNVEQFYHLDRDHLLHCLADLETKLESGFAFRVTPLAWLRYILKNDQRQQSTLFTSGANRKPRTPEQTARMTEQRAARERIAHLENVLVDVRSQFERERRSALEQALAQIPEAERITYTTAAIAKLEDFTRRLVKPDTFWRHPLCRSQVQEFLTERGFPPLITYEQYCQQVGVEPSAIEAEIDTCKRILSQ